MALVSLCMGQGKGKRKENAIVASKKKQQQEVATGVWPFFSFDIMNNKHTKRRRKH